MKKIYLLLSLMLLPLVASAQVNIGGIYYELNSESKIAEVVLTPLGEYTGDIVIPMLVSYDNIQYSVTSIGGAAFHSCFGLTSITIPNSVTSIGGGAFYGCCGLTSITIPSSVTSIGEDAFCGCSGLTSISVENGNTVYDSRNNCNAIIETGSNTLISGCVNTIIPNSVTSIGGRAFYDCCSLTSITIPNSVTSIGEDAFSDCCGLTSVTIPNSVTSIGGHAFLYCYSLTSISVENGNTVYDSRNDCNAIIKTGSNTLILGCRNTIIPNSVTSIGNCAFYGSDGLTSITIPNSVTSIGELAFEYCYGLTSITSLNPIPPTINWDTFRHYTAVLNVPIGSKAAYQAADYWRKFTNIEEIDVSGVQGIQVDKNQDAMVYDLNGRRLNAPTKGVGIINGRKVLMK